MKIALKTITCLAAEGRPTIQVPEISIGGPTPSETIMDVPDEYFTRLNDNLPSRHGFLYLSRKGYEHFKPDLQKAFSDKRGCTWKDFTNAAEDHFATVAKAIERKKASLKKKLAELDAAVI